MCGGRTPRTLVWASDMRRKLSRGTFNATKLRVLVYMSDRFDKGYTGAIGVRRICLKTGGDYNYLKSRLKVWATWGYLKCYTLTPGKGRPYYGYTIGVEGRAFLNRLSSRSLVRTRRSLLAVGPPGSGIATISQPGSGIDTISRPGQWLDSIARADDGF